MIDYTLPREKLSENSKDYYGYGENMLSEFYQHFMHKGREWDAKYQKYFTSLFQLKIKENKGKTQGIERRG